MNVKILDGAVLQRVKPVDDGHGLSRVDLINCFSPNIEYPLVTFATRNEMSGFVHYQVWPSPELWIGKIVNLRLCPEEGHLIGDVWIFDSIYTDIKEEQMTSYGAYVNSDLANKEGKYIYRFSYVNKK